MKVQPSSPRPSSPSILLDLLEILLPSPCLNCSDPTRAWRPLLGLCVTCRGRLRPLRSTCRLCCAPITGSSGHPGITCTACSRKPPAFDQLFAVWSYAPPLDSVIHQLKFGRLAYLGEHLGELIAGHLASTLPPVDLIVPVPLHWTRLLTRGYNQAEEIARSAGRHLQLPMRRVLLRHRRTRAQTSLSGRRRRSNLLDAFRVLRGSAVAGRRIALLDDVATTGATLSSGAAALKAAGAGTVIAVAAARAGRLAPMGKAGKNLEDSNEDCGSLRRT